MFIATQAECPKRATLMIAIILCSITIAGAVDAQEEFLSLLGEAVSSTDDPSFGFAAASGYFDDDDQLDLVVGAPYLDQVPGNTQHGAVYAYYGPFAAGQTPDSYKFTGEQGVATGLGISVSYSRTYRYQPQSTGLPVFVTGQSTGFNQERVWGIYEDSAVHSFMFVPGTTDHHYFGDFLGSCDFNGDSYDDIIVRCGNTNSHVRIFLGGENADSIVDVIIWCQAASAYFGDALAGIKDVTNDDGTDYDDLLIGDPSNSRVHVLFGRWVSQAPEGSPTEITISGDPQELGVNTISFPNVAAVAGGDDLTGDGVRDIVLSGGSTVKVFSGPINETEITTPYVTFQGGAGFGSRLALEGDVNGVEDNDAVYNDLIIGSDNQDYGRGRVTIVLGGVRLASDTVPNADQSSTRNVWQLKPAGLPAEAHFGAAIGFMGDQSGDGRDEIFVGAYGIVNPNTGWKSGKIYGFDLSQSAIEIADSAEPILTGPLCEGESSRALAVHVESTTAIRVFAIATSLGIPTEIELLDGGANGDLVEGDQIYSRELLGMTYWPGDPVNVEVFARANNVTGGFALKDVEVKFFGTPRIGASAEFPIPRVYGNPYPLIAVSTTECAGIDIQNLVFYGDQSLDETPFGWGILTLTDDGTYLGDVPGDGIFCYRGSLGTNPVPPPGYYDFSVLGMISGHAGFALEDAVQIEVIDPVVNYVNRSGDTGLNYPGQPYSSVVIDFDQAGPKDMFISLIGQNAKLYKCTNVSAGVPQFLAASLSETGGAPPANLLGLTVADYDNDGRQDLFAASQTSGRLYHAGVNAGLPVLADVSSPISGLLEHSITGAWGDYNRDGRVDLFVGRGTTTGEPGVDSGTPLEGVLLRNDTASSGGFTDVSYASGVGRYLPTYCASATWGDFDNDRFPDLFVGDASGSGASRLFRNTQSGGFVEEADDQLGSSVNSVVGASFYDADNDGDLDLAIARSTDVAVRLNSGNSQNSLTESAPVAASLSPLSGLRVIDHNSDGLQDVLLLPAMASERPRLYKARSGPLVYVDVAGDIGLNSTGKTGGSVVSDFNADGDLDLYLGRAVSNGAFFFTAAGETPAIDPAFSNWVRVKLKSTIGVPNNYLGIGAKVTVTQGPTNYVRFVDGGSGRGSQDDQTLLFGLPNEAAVNIAVDWPNGYHQEMGATVGSTVTIEDNTTGFSLTGTAGSYAIIPNTTLSTWTFKWTTSVGTNPALDRIVYKIGDPNWQSGGTTVWATSSGVTHTEFAGAAGYQHKLVITGVPCALGQTVYFAAKSEGAPGQVATGATRSFAITVCGTEYQPNQP